MELRFEASLAQDFVASRHLPGHGQPHAEGHDTQVDEHPHHALTISA
jgi:hypothetical protein